MTVAKVGEPVDGRAVEWTVLERKPHREVRTAPTTERGDHAALLRPGGLPQVRSTATSDSVPRSPAAADSLHGKASGRPATATT